MVGFRYVRHCRRCGEIGEVYGKKSKVCKDCFDKALEDNIRRTKERSEKIRNNKLSINC